MISLWNWFFIIKTVNEFTYNTIPLDTKYFEFFYIKLSDIFFGVLLKSIQLNDKIKSLKII